MDNRRVLVVEDEEIAREYLAEALRDKGFQVDEATAGTEALASLGEAEYAVVVSDIRMPGMDGMRLLEQVRDMSPDTEVILVTGYASIEDAVQAVKMGAFQYVAKPLRLDEVAVIVDRALAKRRAQVELRELRRHVDNANLVHLVGQSSAMERLKRQLNQLAQADCTVLILGATGTGKELAARALYAGSRRSGKRFLAVNCATFSDDLLARELFGHEKGAFTGAYTMQKGLLEAADKGVFFLDEIGDMSLGMQASMLRVLESRTILRVGGTKEIPVDVRIIAATNKDLKQMVEEGTFRRDLFYRLHIMTLQLPSLSERRDDVPLLAHFFVGKHCALYGKKSLDIDKRTMALLQAHDYPGNVRELRHALERAVIVCTGDTILPAHLPAEFTGSGARTNPSEDGNRLVSLEENERLYLAKVMRLAEGSVSRASELLDINRGTLWRKLKRFGMLD